MCHYFYGLGSFGHYSRQKRWNDRKEKEVRALRFSLTFNNLEAAQLLRSFRVFHCVDAEKGFNLNSAPKEKQAGLQPEFKRGIKAGRFCNFVKLSGTNEKLPTGSTGREVHLKQGSERF